MKVKKAEKYNYGECEICDSPMREKRVKQDFWIGGELIVVGNVPAGVCPRCGEKVVKAEVGRCIMKLLQNKTRISKAPRILVPALRL